MSTATSVLNIPSRTVNRRAGWLALAAAVLGAAVALSATAILDKGSAPPAASVSRPAAVAKPASEGSGSLPSLRPLSDAGFEVSVPKEAPAIYRSGVLFNYPEGTVRVGANGVESPVQARFGPGTTYVYPGGSVQIGAKANGGTNENAPAVEGCAQCR